MLIDLIAGARPNFMKIASIIHEMERNKNGKSKLEYRLIHTGQHYDYLMSEYFFDQLNIPPPDFNLEVGSGTQGEQTGKIMIGYEKIILQEKCDLCLVVGDVTSTLACSIVAKKSGVKVGHVEAGLRSGDFSMPEEINRIVTDSISDYFFTTSEFAGKNLEKSGINPSSVFFVGNTMIDTLLKHQSNFLQPKIWDLALLKEKNYLILTLHRPGNVDDKDKLINIINEIVRNSSGVPIIFPAHPRTLKNLKFGFSVPKNLFLIDPLGYLEFNYLVKHSMGVITDSGGITEETTVLGIPCMTLRNSTERPETCEIGTNVLLGNDIKNIGSSIQKLLNKEWKKGSIPALWDGRASERIILCLIEIFHL